MADVKLDPKGLKSAVEAASELACDGGAPVHDYVSGIIAAYLRASPAAAGVEGVSPSDPATILAGIKQFGLAADGSDLRDLASAIESLQREIADQNFILTAQKQALGEKSRELEAAEARIAELERERDTAEAMSRLQAARADVAEARARRMEEALREALHVLQQIPDRQRSKRHKCAIGEARAALSDSPAAEPVAGQGEDAREALIAELIDIYHCGLRHHDIEPTADRILAALRPAPGVVEPAKPFSMEAIARKAGCDLGGNPLPKPAPAAGMEAAVEAATRDIMGMTGAGCFDDVLATKIKARITALLHLSASLSGEDARLLDALRDESWDLRCFDMPTAGGDGDIGWRVIGHWQAKPHERVVAEVYHDEPRDAIRAALASPRGQEGGEG